MADDWCGSVQAGDNRVAILIVLGVVVMVNANVVDGMPGVVIVIDAVNAIKLAVAFGEIAGRNCSELHKFKSHKTIMESLL
ncbi:Hypothetical predicted protein [Octopus vulgaris]|uniref:Uncharacterized protein n=1 Tax=Octopus vulgaris TaxID=6645 RepID=A0AA36BKI9_OCTVU|nr:Hypothetical predicted protein [Octopus vulgaris]